MIEVSTFFHFLIYTYVYHNKLFKENLFYIEILKFYNFIANIISKKYFDINCEFFKT